MGILMPVGGHQATLRWTLAGDLQEQITTIGFDNVAILAPTALAELIYDLCVSPGSICVAAEMLNDYTFNGVTVQNRQGDGMVVGEHLEPVNGVDSTSPITSNCALLVHKRTLAGGRRGRGRSMPPLYNINEAAVDVHGILAAPTYSFLGGIWDFLYTNMVSSGVPPELYHEDGAPGTPITEFAVDLRIATQRRRMR